MENRNDLVVSIDEYGNLNENGFYKVTLTGSYTYNRYFNHYEYEVKKIIPKIPLKKIITQKLL